MSNLQLITIFLSPVRAHHGLPSKSTSSMFLDHPDDLCFLRAPVQFGLYHLHGAQFIPCHSLLSICLYTWLFQLLEGRDYVICNNQRIRSIRNIQLSLSIFRICGQAEFLFFFFVFSLAGPSNSTPAVTVPVLP